LKITQTILGFTLRIQLSDAKNPSESLDRARKNPIRLGQSASTLNITRRWSRANLSAENSRAARHPATAIRFGIDARRGIWLRTVACRQCLVYLTLFLCILFLYKELWRY
jgi:hypothetical protein